MTKPKPRRRNAAASAAPPPLQDLVVLVADSDLRETINGLLSTRTKSLHIRPVTHVTIAHPNHDPGCANHSIGLLTGYRRTHRHALVIFDYEGSGRDQTDSRIDLEEAIEADLNKAGWEGRAAVIAIAPELEAWVWGPSPHVAGCLGWKHPELGMREWLVQEGFLATATQLKPDRPKEAMDAVLRFVKRSRSAATYRVLAEKVGLSQCTDPAFAKLRAVLRTWFPVQDQEPPADTDTL